MVSGRKIIGPQFFCPFPQNIELYVLVTPDTGIRSSSSGILLTKIIHHPSLKGSFQVYDMVGNFELGCNTIGIGDCAPTATRAGAVAILFGKGIQIHRDTDHFETSILQKRSRYGRVYSPTHGYKDPLFSHGITVPAHLEYQITRMTDNG
jgi:hypothetical protein